ncbi:MAG: T9SS type A sorting domain-containing protein [Bacteroidales bacterium]|nr:T9SS type A sorting domain-containing protein [Bacteroidales bacterium]MCF8457552.1 T9SS type A sorting domain-containing protein [Bacteroidales bacterium]
MKKTFILLVAIVISANLTQLKAQNYSTGFDTPAGMANWTEFRKGDANPFYYWEISTFSSLSAPNCLSHGYPVGGTVATDDWFVSPAFDFSNGGSIDSVWHSFAGFGLPMAGDTVAFYLLTGSNDPDLALSKTMLFDYRDTNYVADNTWTLDTNIVVPPQTGSSYIAFRYYTTNNWLDVKFDDVRISSTGTIGISALSNNNLNISLFPNPASEVVSLQVPDEINIHSLLLFNAAGQQVVQFDKDNRTIDLQTIPGGLYILKIATNKGIVTQKLIK